MYKDVHGYTSMYKDVKRCTQSRVSNNHREVGEVLSQFDKGFRDLSNVNQPIESISVQGIVTCDF
jgi:hypothetical protein